MSVWSDDFTGAADTPVDGGNWLYDLGTGYPGGASNWGTGEIETMTNSTNNVYLDGQGRLAIKPIRDGQGAWTSGRIETQRSDFRPPSGGVLRVQAAITLPDVTGEGAQGYWPAFWMLGAPFRGNYGNWPGIGEMDILESVNGQNTVHGTFHCGVDPGGPCKETDGLGGPVMPTSDPWGNSHTYSVEWDSSTSPQQIRWYVDGNNYWTVTENDVDAVTWANATDHGFMIILNVGMGGGWPGNPTPSTVSGQPMLVDYVAVYGKASGNGSGGAAGNASGGAAGVAGSSASGGTAGVAGSSASGGTAGVAGSSASGGTSAAGGSGGSAAHEQGGSAGAASDGVAGNAGVVSAGGTGGGAGAPSVGGANAGASDGTDGFNGASAAQSDGGGCAYQTHSFARTSVKALAGLLAVAIGLIRRRRGQR